MGILIGRPPRSWEVAVTKINTIYILDPNTTHHRHLTAKNFDVILHHELVHVFYNSLIPEGVPYWLNEGLAYRLARQKFKTYANASMALRALRYYAHFDPAIYQYGPALTDLLIRENSFSALMGALRTFSKTSHHPKEFYKIFHALLVKLPTDAHP